MRLSNEHVKRLAKRALGKCVRRSGCLVYTGALSTDGYPKTTTTLKGNRVDLLLHRVVFQAEVGKLRRGKLVCHKCDNPACLNPRHLFSGSPLANMRDKVAKGRHRAPGPKSPARGVANHNAKLDAQKVRAIRKDPRPLAVLAEELGVSISTVGKARTGQTWAHIK